jgi:hypothetical protein
VAQEEGGGGVPLIEKPATVSFGREHTVFQTFLGGKREELPIVSIAQLSILPLVRVHTKMNKQGTYSDNLGSQVGR